MKKEAIIKSLKKAIKNVRHKNAIEDVMDSNRVAEIPLDEIPSGKSGVIQKSKECECEKEEKDCDCEEKIDKKKDLIKNITKNFRIISEAYLEKMESKYPKLPESPDFDKLKEETDKRKKVAEERIKGLLSPRSKQYRERKIVGEMRQKNPRLPKMPDFDKSEDGGHPDFFNQHEGIIPESHPDRIKAASYINKLAQKPGKEGGNENKLEARRLYDKHISGGGEYVKKAESKDKPFHGYNKEKHSKEGGLSEKAREKYNRENNSNLKAPVSSKEAKKSPKKAARRKSFCARMSGVKGPTSKKGKLTPKGAALKRWDC